MDKTPKKEINFTEGLQMNTIKQRKPKASKHTPQEKQKIIDILYNKFGLVGVPGELIQIPETALNYYRMPDITILQINTVIELVKPFPGFGNGNSKKEDMLGEETDYTKAGYKLIRVHQEVTNGYDEEKVIEVLEQNGLKRI